MLALARMVFDPRAYVPQSEKKRPDLKLSPQDVLAREEHYEHLAAEAIMKQILGAAHISESDLKSAVESNGAKWYERGEAIELPWAKPS
jgi:hypothetical protein